MSIIKLTEDLSNFTWTKYENVGSGQKPQSFDDGRGNIVTGQRSFNRPSQKALEEMESEFGPKSTDVGSRGSYGVADFMDGTKKGRGFIVPGEHPLGFITDMTVSNIEINNELTLTPLSYTIAGMNSSLDHGVVSEQTLNITPILENAWGSDFMTLPIENYVSKYAPPANFSETTDFDKWTQLDSPFTPISYDRTRSTFNHYPINVFTPEGSIHIDGDDAQGTIGGGVTKFASLIPIPGYPQNLDAISKLFVEEEQRTLFRIPEAYPDTTLAFTLEGDAPQFGFDKSTKYNDYGVTPPAFEVNLFPTGTTRTKGLVSRFYKKLADTEYVWPYKVLSVSSDHQPYIRKDVGQRYSNAQTKLGEVTSWLTLVSSRAGDDVQRIESWLRSPIGRVWRGNQVILQGLNPRPETRLWSEYSIIGSLPPMVHVQRHMTVPFIGDGSDYENYKPFGEIPGSDYENMRKYGFGIRYGDNSDHQHKGGGTVTRPQGGAYEGRLWRLTEEFIIPEILAPAGGPGFLGGIAASIAGAIGDIFSGKSFGRTPVTPTQVVKSQGGPFGQKGIATSKLPDANEPGDIIKRYSTLAYGKLGSDDVRYSNRLGSPSELSVLDTVTVESSNELKNLISGRNDLRNAGKKIVDGTGQQGRSYVKTEKDPKIFKDEVWDAKADDDNAPGAGLGLIKGGVLKAGEGINYANELTDRVNMLPYGQDYTDSSTGTVSDFIKFKFFDVVNKKFLIFRALLSGITDTITPDWTDQKYIGRPDKVYTYQGASRAVAFTFDIYPKTKQEFPVLLEKLNYLVGLCYPSFKLNRMVAPFINLTIGDMFVDTPGFIDSLSITVEDNTTWELDEGLQFPKYIKCACGFTYIGKYMPSSLGKHYELPWLTDYGWTNDEVGKAVSYGTFKASGKPKDKGKMKLHPEREPGTFHYKLFSNLNATNSS